MSSSSLLCISLSSNPFSFLNASSCQRQEISYVFAKTLDRAILVAQKKPNDTLGLPALLGDLMSNKLKCSNVNTRHHLFLWYLEFASEKGPRNNLLASWSGHRALVSIILLLGAGQKAVKCKWIQRCRSTCNRGWEVFIVLQFFFSGNRSLVLRRAHVAEAYLCIWPPPKQTQGFPNHHCLHLKSVETHGYSQRSVENPKQEQELCLFRGEWQQLASTKKPSAASPWSWLAASETLGNLDE